MGNGLILTMQLKKTLSAQMMSGPGFLARDRSYAQLNLCWELHAESSLPIETHRHRLA
jgi:hypothetical protein